MQVQLYHKWHCPYSARVRDFIDEHRIEGIQLIDAEDAHAAEELVGLTDQFQVPCLVVGGKPLLESSEIISWIQKHLATADSTMSRPWDDSRRMHEGL